MAEFSDRSKKQYIMVELYLLSGKNTAFFWKKAQYIFYVIYMLEMGSNS